MTWSLAVEEQFYLTLPLYIQGTQRPLAGARPRDRHLRRTIAANRTSTISTAPDWVGIYTMMLCRADALLLGVLAAVLLRNDRWKERIRERRLGFLRFDSHLVIGHGISDLASMGIMTPPFMKTVGYTWVALFYVDDPAVCAHAAE